MTTMTKTAKGAGRPRAVEKDRTRQVRSLGGRTRAKAHDLGAALVEAAKEMLAFERDETDGQRVVVYRGTEREAVVTAAPAFSSARIAELRARLKQSQPIFALMLNVSVETVRAWEQGRRTPEGSALRLLQVADASPEVLLRNVNVK